MSVFIGGPYGRLAVMLNTLSSLNIEIIIKYRDYYNTLVQYAIHVWGPWIQDRNLHVFGKLDAQTMELGIQIKLLPPCVFKSSL